METETRGQHRTWPEVFDLAFLHERAADPRRTSSDDERQATEVARRSLMEAGAIVARLGGRSGRLGECVVGTALLEGALQTVRVLGKAGIPVHIVVDANAAELFDAAAYDIAYWPGFVVLPATDGDADDGIARALGILADAEHTVVLDLHGGHDGMPELRSDERYDGSAQNTPRRVTTLARLFRTGVRTYAERGPLRRYADFCEDLFGLQRTAIDGHAAQPALRLSPADLARYPELARQAGLHPDALQIVAFFQSVVAAKCYTRWDEALSLLCERVAAAAPSARLDVLIACGPDDAALPAGATCADLEATFGAFRGTHDNARVVVAATPSLRDLAVLVSRAALVLADDTGPGHIAGALGIPTVTPYLPGNVYSKRVWASSLSHRGLTLDPSPYTFEQIRDAVLWDSTHILDSISPEALASAAVDALARRLADR